MEQESEEALWRIVGEVRGADEAARATAEAYVEALAAPPGSLGRLAEAAVQLAGITGQVKNTLGRYRVIVLCADNGVAAEGVSATPQSVTLSQALNMTRRLTGMSSLAAHFGDEVEVVDVGIATPYEEGGCGIVQRRIRMGTGNIEREPAMSREEAVKAIFVGIERARQAAEDGVGAIGVGEMGIGNTTTSSAVLAALTGLPVEAVTGRGGGLTDEAFARKKAVIARALRRYGLAGEVKAEKEPSPVRLREVKAEKEPSLVRALEVKAEKEPSLVRALEVKAEKEPSPVRVLDVLAKVGGLDIAAMCGVFLGAARYSLPVVVDGFISIVAALCAQRLCPKARDYMFPSHLSEEVGYRRAARELGLEPWLDMNMRLGEGSGCPLAFRILEAACVLTNDMATFKEAAIDDSYLKDLRSQRGHAEDSL